MTVALNSPETSQEAPGNPPRVGPVLSATTRFPEAYRAAGALGLVLRPWQEHALKVSMAVEGQTFKYREVAIIAARQNGKSKILLPRIHWALQNGRRIVHTAQNAKLPRQVFMQLVNYYRHKGAYIRLANGQEEISLPNGGTYMIIAPQRGARGLSADDLIVDELREMEDFDFIAAAEPILTESTDPQVIYLSNAGTEKSVVLNDLRDRVDPNLAYMEWSAAPWRAADDRDGWLEANPSIGYGNNDLEKLQALHDKYQKAGELAIFETEHLCRWVKSMRPRLVLDAYVQASRGEVEWPPTRPVFGISVDPNGQRASCAMAWLQADGRIGVTLVGDINGDPVDLSRFGTELQDKASEFVVDQVAYDSWTDQHLARYFMGAKPVIAAEFANASERFVRVMETGGLVIQWADKLIEELPHASRRDVSQSAWVADRAGERPITTVLAAARAVWLASNPRAAVGEIY